MAAILAFFLCLAASARDRMLTIYTEPPGAVVSDYLGELGVTGQPLKLRPSYGGGQITLTVALPGYRTETISLSEAVLTTQDYFPPGQSGPGVLRLRPASPQAFLRTYRLPLLAGALLLGLATALILRFRAHARRHAERADHIEQLVAGAPVESTWLGRSLGGYRLTEPLGKGAMATVYRGQKGSESVAVKVLVPEVTDDPGFLARFQREVSLSRGLFHPHLVQVLDWGELDGCHYLVLELVEGGTLRERIRPGGTPASEIKALLDPIFRAVQHAHSQGVVHRDLKPENILMTRGGQPKVTDFGMGRASDSEKVTATGTTLGTPAYIAPEQVTGGVLQPSSDQYSLGILTFELLTGRRPFDDTDPVALLFKQVSKACPPPSRFKEMPPEVDRVVLRMLAKDASQRYPSVEEARVALLAALEGW